MSLVPSVSGAPGTLWRGLAPAHDATELALKELVHARGRVAGANGTSSTARALDWTRMAQLDILKAHETPAVADAWAASHRALDHLGVAQQLLAGVEATLLGERFTRPQLTAITKAQQHLRAVSTRTRDTAGEVSFQDGWLAEATRAANEPGYARDPRLVVYDPAWGGARRVDDVLPDPDARRVAAWQEQTDDAARDAAGGDTDALRDGLDHVMLGMPVDMWLKSLADYPIPVEIARNRARSLTSPLFKAELRIDNPVLAPSYDEADALALARARASGVPHGVVAGSMSAVAVAPIRVDRPWPRSVLGAEQAREATLAGATAALARHERVIWVDNLLSRVATPDGRMHQTTPRSSGGGGFNPRWPSPASTRVSPPVV